ncbi:hypothetical protein ACOMHN_058367 [Nucella lapillus]
MDVLILACSFKAIVTDLLSTNTVIAFFVSPRNMEAKHLKDQRSTPAQPARRQSPSPGHSQRTARGAERSMDRRSTPAQPAQPARRQSPSPGYSQRTARGAERSMDQRSADQRSTPAQSARSQSASCSQRGMSKQRTTKRRRG